MICFKTLLQLLKSCSKSCVDYGLLESTLRHFRDVRLQDWRKLRETCQDMQFLDRHSKPDLQFMTRKHSAPPRSSGGFRIRGTSRPKICLCILLASANNRLIRFSTLRILCDQFCHKVSVRRRFPTFAKSSSLKYTFCRSPKSLI